MKLQYIQNSKGLTTGVYIPIEEWQLLKTKYAEFQNEEVENVIEFEPWQRKVIDERLNDYYNNADKVVDFDQTLDDIEKSFL